ncbi:Replication protein A subunit [Aphelenchoides besseyi]|nr:Replication protein A subunit [Aphelenchoides besseyi]KAI6209576.1 Replication protein A subunit [Aphelenchoides besseyi]
MAVPEEDLTTGFFNKFACSTASDGQTPLLQVLESRRVSTGVGSKTSLRCRMSDGAFSSAYCMGSEEIADRFAADGIYGTNATIRVLEYNRRLVGDKAFFHIVDYTLVGFPRTTIGDPRPHNGNPDEFRGVENFSLALKAESDLNAMSLPASRKRPFASNDANQGSFKRAANGTSGGVFNNVVDIAAITPFISTFRICGIATSKDSPRDINTKRGPSKVFSFVLTDGKGDSIKVTAFGAECDKYADFIEKDKAYYIYCGASGVVREANKRFNSTNNSYEITLNSKCDVDLCTDRQIQNTPVKVQPVPLACIKNNTGNCIDVIAVVEKIEEPTSLTSKAGKQLVKRDAYLIDDSMVRVRITFWEEQALSFDVPEGTVITLKGVSVREFNGGFTLSASSSCCFYTDLENEYTLKLQKWLVNKPDSSEFGSLAGDGGSVFERDFRLIKNIEKSCLPAGDEKGVWAWLLATVNNVRSENAYYSACLNCPKKVVEENHQFRCDRCGVNDSFRYLYKLNIEISDFSGTAWVSIFDELAQQLVGIDASQLASLHENNRDEYDRILSEFKLNMYEMKVRARIEEYNEQQRVSWTCTAIRQVNRDRATKLFESYQAIENRV